MSNWNLRFRRRLTLVPGVGLNLNKNSASVSLGPKHAKLTVGPHGIRQTVGLPGSGFYLTRNEPWQARRSAPQRMSPPSGTNPAGLVFTAAGGFLRGIAWVALAVLGLAAIGSWLGH